MKLAIYIPSFPISETFIFRELQALKQQGLNFEVYSLEQPREKYLWQTNIIKFKIQFIFSFFLCLLKKNELLRHLFKNESIQLKSFLKDLYISFYLSREFKEGKFHHLHAHFVSRPGLVALLGKKKFGIPYSLSAHARDAYVEGGDLKSKLNHAKWTLACSSRLQQYLRKVAPEASDKIHLMYHGLDLPSKSNLSKANGNKILLVGRLVEKKGFLPFLKMIPLLDPSFTFHIIGDGPQAEDLNQVIRARHLEKKVFLHGKLHINDILTKMQDSFALITPSIIASDGDHDNIPNVILEAMASYCPVVASPVGGIGEAIEHLKTGWLLEELSPASLNKALLALKDSGLRQSLTQSAFLKVQAQFSLTHNIQVFKNLLANT